MFPKTTLLLLLFLGLTSLFAQVNNNLVFYSSGGEKFQVVLNGVKQNAQAQTNVKVTDLNAQNYEAKIVFQDRSLGEISKMLMMPESSSEVTMRVLKNKKGKYVVRYFGEVPLASAPAPATDQYVVVYSTEQRYEEEPVVRDLEVTLSETTTTTTTTTSEDEDVPPSSGGFVDINIDGTSIQVGVQVEDDMVDGNISVSTSGSTTTTTTTTTTSSSSSSSNYHEGDDDIYYEDNSTDGRYHMPGYDGKIGCDWPMSQEDFGEASRSIGSKTFEDSKLTLAKQIAQSNCLLAEQVRDIMKLLEYEASRVEFAKFAYPKTYDQGNYFKVNDAFEYELSIDELDEFIVK